MWYITPTSPSVCLPSTIADLTSQCSFLGSFKIFATCCLAWHSRSSLLASASATDTLLSWPLFYHHIQGLTETSLLLFPFLAGVVRSRAFENWEACWHAAGIWLWHYKHPTEKHIICPTILINWPVITRKYFEACYI